MNKILLAAAVSAALFTVQANAAVVPPGYTSTQLPIDSVTGKPDFSTKGIQHTSVVPLSNILYTAGSSAAAKFFEASLLQLANPGTAVYKYASNTTADILTYIFQASSTSGLTSSQTYVVHYRNRDGSLLAPLLAAATTPDKATGVTFNNPVFIDKNIATVGCVTKTATTSTTVGLILCTGTVADSTATALVVAPKTATGTSTAVSSTLGLSDVDSAQFASPLNGANAANLLADPKKGAATFASTAIAAQVFGVAVNVRLRDAMQRAEIASLVLPSSCTVGDETEACIPNLTSEQITSIFADGRFNDWTNLSYASGSNLVTANAGHVPGNTAVHICSRTAGSGTLATLQAKFENAPCTSANEAKQMANSTTAVPQQTNVVGTELANAATKVFHSNVGSGDVDKCLNALDNSTTNAVSGIYDGTTATGTTIAANATAVGYTGLTVTTSTNDDFRWAVGILNANRNNDGKTGAYRFVKIDGYTPSLANTANGKYRFWSELSYISKTVAAATPVNLLPAVLIAKMQDPAIIGASSTKVNLVNLNGYKSGYLGVAGTALSITTAFDDARPVMPFTHANKDNAIGSVNHCRAPAILTGNKYLPGLN